MKRNKNLEILSHHHHGLKLTNGIKKGTPGYKKLPNDIPGKEIHSISKFNTCIGTHFEDEEQIHFSSSFTGIINYSGKVCQ